MGHDGRKEVAATGKLVTLNDLAKHLHMRAQTLYREIEEHHWSEPQGVFRVLPGKHGLRIDEYQFLNWRRMPTAALGDAHVRDVTKHLLALLLPIRTALEAWTGECNRMYEAAAARLDEPPQRLPPPDCAPETWPSGKRSVQFQRKSS